MYAENLGSTQEFQKNINSNFMKKIEQLKKPKRATVICFKRDHPEKKNTIQGNRLGILYYFFTY